MQRNNRIKSCVHCRQMKVKCNADKVFPAPCSRCTKFKLGCSVDPNFQRTAKRRKLLELEKQLQEIKASIETSPTSVSPEQSQLEASDIPDATDTLGAIEHSITPTQSQFESQQIGGIQISAIAICEIVDCYYRSYHPHFPILPDYLDFVKTWNHSNLLLWTVLAIGSKEMDAYSSYRSLLEPKIQQLAANIYSFQDNPLYSVQALLLLCWWPFNFSATRNDPSWMYCGQATHTALQHGLHRPHHHSDFVYRTELDEASIQTYRRVWAGCFIINQMLSSNLGIPATIQPTTFGNIRANTLNLPVVLEKQVKLAYQCHSICHVLGNYGGTMSGLLPNPEPTVDVFDSQLNSLQDEIRAESDTDFFVEIALHQVRLHLYAFMLTAEDGYLTRKASKIPATNPEATPYLIQASSTAVNLINLIANRASQEAWAAMARIAILHALNFLLMLLTIPGYRDQPALRSSISEAWRLFQSKSEFENDTFSRMCKFTAYLCRVYTEGNQDSVFSTRSVKSRMAANFVFENIWRAKKRFSQSVHDSKPVDYTAAAEIEDLSLLGFADELFDPSLFDGFNTDEAFSWLS